MHEMKHRPGRGREVTSCGVQPRYATRCVILTRSPLRISLGGGGTDLPSYYSRHGGFVVSAAIDKYVYIYVNRPAIDDLLRVKYSRYEEVTTPEEVEHDLVRHALVLLDIRRNVEIASMAEIPAGTGLGSSGTYLVGVLVGLLELKRERLPVQELAEIACHIEMELAHHPVGKHDHYLAAFGGITCLDIDTSGRVAVTALKIDRGLADELRRRVLLFFTGMTRSADGILGQQRSATESGDSSVVESLHRTKTMGYEIRDALERGDLDRFGPLLHEHWENKKRRSAQISDERIDRWYARARAAGATGGKIIGAGGGGFLMLYCPDGTRDAVRQQMAAEGLRELRYAFDHEGAKVLVNI